MYKSIHFLLRCRKLLYVLVAIYGVVFIYLNLGWLLNRQQPELRIAVSREAEETLCSITIPFALPVHSKALRLKNEGLLHMTEYESIGDNDALWEQMKIWYFPNFGQYVADCSYSQVLATVTPYCWCSFMLQELYTRYLRMAPPSYILDMDIAPKLSKLNKFGGIKTDDVGLPQLSLFATAMGHSVILFESSEEKAQKISSILRVHRLEERATIYLSGLRNIDQVVQNISVPFVRISANGLEEQVLEGGKNLFSDPLRTKVIVLKYFPFLVRLLEEEPTNIILKLLKFNFKIQVLLTRFSIPNFQPNSIINSLNVNEFTTALEDSFAYLFCSRNQDLAIPDARTFLRIDEIIPGQFKSLYRTCSPPTDAVLRWTTPDHFEIVCPAGSPVATYVTNRESSEYTGEVFTKSEFVCASVKCPGHVVSEEKCITRFERLQDVVITRKVKNNRPNFLVIMLNGVGRQVFTLMMKRISTRLPLISNSSFTYLHYPYYYILSRDTVVNQRAFFSGYGNKDPHDASNPRFLWNLFKQAGYTTLKADSTCYNQSPFLLSIDWKSENQFTNHNFQQIFCSEEFYRRPHCTGTDYNAKHTIDYLENFVKTYTQTQSPWAAFVNFHESEDSSILLGVVDIYLDQFLQRNVDPDTFIIFASEQGEMYGPLLQSAGGYLQSLNPALHILAPIKHTLSKENLLQNQHNPISALNIYWTIRDFAGLNGTEADEHNLNKYSLERADGYWYCKDVGVPSHFCAHLHRSRQYECRVPFHPSSNSFLADSADPIPKCSSYNNRNISKIEDNFLIMFCFPNEKGSFWVEPNGDEITWVSPVKIDPTVEFLYTKCADSKGNSRTNLHVKLVPLPSSRLPEPNQQLPDIYVIITDATSDIASQQFLQKTTMFMNNVNLYQGSEYVQFHFKKFNSVGGSTVPNQVAMLSGCISIWKSSKLTDSMLLEVPNKYDSTYRLYCYNDGYNTRWIFNEMKKKGYVTLFGEEICRQTQKSVAKFFDKDFTDHEIGEIYCDNSIEEGMCSGGHFLHNHTLRYLMEFVDMYRDRPKFSWVDLTIGHQANRDPRLLRSLDSPLKQTLQTLMSDHREKVIFVMGDHGLDVGANSYTRSGQIEHNLPLLRLLISQQLLDRWKVSSEVLFYNQNNLVTAYDLYTTLRHIQVLSGGTGVNEASTLYGAPAWSFSLFEPIPYYRTCSDARIPNKFCSCNEG